MSVLVTGGTGFVGSHIVVALRQAGHDVRLLVRRPEQVGRTFASHGLSASELPDVVVGDVLDEAVVQQAVDGCRAVVHAAAVFSFDTRRGAEMLDTNERAARLVLGAAQAAGCDPIVHISSTVALVRRGGSSPDLPLGDVEQPYSRSKIASERVARELQDAGAPVVTVYPGGVWGPHDPYDGEQTARARFIAWGLFPLWPTGRLHVVDVRDVAAVVVGVLEPGHGPRRYVVPGHFVGGSEIFGAVGRAIGRPRPFVLLPGAVALPMTRVVDLAQSRLPARLRYPADHEATEVAMRDSSFDDRPAREDLGVHPRSFDETVRDQIAWMVDTGRLPERYRPR